jgi:glycosyltransferase involved in cell wall biosynthesis
LSKILYFSRDYTTHDHRFLSALAGSQHQVAYLRLENRGGELEDRPLPVEIEQIPWAGGQSEASLWDGLRLLADLKRVIREVQPDLIQAGPIQRCALLAALAGFKPLLSMSWGYDLIHDATRGLFWRWATRFTLRRSTLMIGDSNATRQLAISYGMQDERIVTFPWGVDLQHFSPPAEYPSDGPRGERPFTLLSTRGWEPIYGVEVIARAFTLAAQERPELRLIMLGNGSQAGLIHRMLSADGLRERVYFPGLVSQTELPRYYRSADLYLSASHSDGSSISLLEAMACGAPALVSDIPGNKEWVTPGQQGWLFPDGDSQALASKILQAMDDRQRLAKMGRAARETVEKRADWKRNFQQLLQAYRKALQITSRGRSRPEHS